MWYGGGLGGGGVGWGPFGGKGGSLEGSGFGDTGWWVGVSE